jgi:hypothetical protein
MRPLVKRLLRLHQQRLHQRPHQRLHQRLPKQ